MATRVTSESVWSTLPTALPANIICFSHLRWSFVYQRPQHLMSRFTREQRVFFFEEPIWGEGEPRLETRRETPQLIIATPHLPMGLSAVAQRSAIRRLLDAMLEKWQLSSYLCWYYTPMALEFTRHLRPVLSVYDCMDQLSHFKGAPAELPQLEHELFARVDAVFTGGQSLYEAKRDLHAYVKAMPSSVDREHFMRAREPAAAAPRDLSGIPGPRIGYLGVIDERIDLALLREMAAAKLEWQFVMVGPVVKIDPKTLPVAANIHYLGTKGYDELPAYLAGWDVAMLPFALNDATRYISPTKTPEYLAAGRPVVSTPIRDVVRPYGDLDLVAVAGDAASFVARAEALLARSDHERRAWLGQVDEFLAKTSWDQTFEAMRRHILQARQLRQGPVAAKTSRPVRRRVVGVPAVPGTASAQSHGQP